MDSTAEKEKRKHGDYQVYRRPSDGCLAFLSLFLATGLGLALAAGLPVGSNFPPAIGIFLFLVGMGIANSFTAQDRLVISDEGIRWRYYGIIGRTTWDNLESIDVRFPVLVGVTWLIFKKPVTVDCPWWLEPFRGLIEPAGSDSLKYRLMLNKYVATLNTPPDQSSVLYELSRTPLGQDIYRYAPHLFDGTDEKMKRDG